MRHALGAQRALPGEEGGVCVCVRACVCAHIKQGAGGKLLYTTQKQCQLTPTEHLHISPLPARDRFM